MIEFKFIKEENYHIISNREFSEFKKTTNESVLKPDDVKKEEHVTALKTYFDWYISYCDSKLKGAIFKDEHIICHIFREHFETPHQFKEYLRKSLYISKEYVTYLKNKINESNISRYKHTISSLSADLEWLIVECEINLNNVKHRIHYTCWRRPNLSPMDIYSAARELFFIEETTRIENLYLRDLKPNVMFQIRQLIEVFGKNLIGYYSISNAKGRPIKKLTQVAWKFIIEELKKPSSNIILPFDINLIIPINTWSNSFVHSTYIYSSYVQFYALKSLHYLFHSEDKEIETFDGYRVNKFDIADIKIENYHSLRSDFEIYVKSKHPDAVVEWMPEKKVGAYIISL